MLGSTIALTGCEKNHPIKEKLEEIANMVDTSKFQGKGNLYDIELKDRNLRIWYEEGRSIIPRIENEKQIGIQHFSNKARNREIQNYNLSCDLGDFGNIVECNFDPTKLRQEQMILEDLDEIIKEFKLRIAKHGSVDRR